MDYKIEKNMLHLYLKTDKDTKATSAMLRTEKFLFDKKGKFINTILHFTNPNNGEKEIKMLDGEKFRLHFKKVCCKPKNIQQCLNCKYTDCINTKCTTISEDENKIIIEGL